MLRHRVKQGQRDRSTDGGVHARPLGLSRSHLAVARAVGRARTLAITGTGGAGKVPRTNTSVALGTMQHVTVAAAPAASAAPTAPAPANATAATSSTQLLLGRSQRLPT